MPWSWKLARIAGIDVYIHAMFFMVIAWIALIHWNESQNLAAVAEGVGYILALFACVVLHEYGHALTAARYGIRTRDITLLPIGVLQLSAAIEHVLQAVADRRLAFSGPAEDVVRAAGNEHRRAELRRRNRQAAIARRLRLRHVVVDRIARTHDAV